MSEDIEWIDPGHKQRRYTLEMSKDWKLFKKSTNRLHATLGTELRCLQYAREEKLTKIQHLVDGNIDNNGVSFIITKYHGVNITKRRVPSDWRNQLDIIDHELRLLIEKYRVYHNDVQARNLFVDLEGRFTLIDFDLGSIGAPLGRATRHPELNTCDKIRDRIANAWGVS